MITIKKLFVQKILEVDDMLTYYVPRRNRARLYRNMESKSSDVYIPLDVIVEGDEYIVSAIIPGVEADAIEIEILEDVVSVTGEFPTFDDEQVKYLLRERPTGKFSRKIRLPKALDVNKAKAEVRDGVLSLRIPQAEHAKARQIAVKAK
jgi:HSP20 family protein